MTRNDEHVNIYRCANDHPVSDVLGRRSESSAKMGKKKTERAHRSRVIVRSLRFVWRRDLSVACPFASVHTAKEE